MEVMSVVDDVKPGCSRDGSLRRTKLEIQNEEASMESSSIGEPDDDDDDDVTDDDEVQSTSSLSCLASLEDSLPIKRGLSKFYAGKSKSFANLTEVKNLKELGKSENPFNKRRRTLMAYNLMFKDDNTDDDHSYNNDHKKKKSGLFYSHSNHISMPLLPLAEEDDGDGDGDVVDDSSDADDYYSFRASNTHLQQIKEHSYPTVNLPTSSSTATAATTTATHVCYDRFRRNS